MLELCWKSNINQLFRKPPGRLIGGVWGGGCPPRNQVKFRLLSAPGQYGPVNLSKTYKYHLLAICAQYNLNIGDHTVPGLPEDES